MHWKGGRNTFSESYLFISCSTEVALHFVFINHEISPLKWQNCQIRDEFGYQLYTKNAFKKFHMA